MLMKMLSLMIALGVTIVSTQSSAQALGGGQQPDLTRQQAQDRADQLFATFDRNHDGVMTPDEARQVGEKLLLQRAITGKDVAPGIGGHTLRFMEQRFAGKQSVTKPEFEQAMLDHFDQMDLNHDGVLTAAEREQANPQVAAR
jgi:Ca2+-binding EF-hand superfamily protein